VKMSGKKEAVLAFALLAPLALYFIPYAYAATSSSYTVNVSLTETAPGHFDQFAYCNTGDYATGGGGGTTEDGGQVQNLAPAGTGNVVVFSGQPTGWFSSVNLIGTGSFQVQVWVVCQSPITVAGVGVPEFGQLYTAIALGAVAFFLFTRYTNSKWPGPDANALAK